MGKMQKRNNTFNHIEQWKIKLFKVRLTLKTKGNHHLLKITPICKLNEETQGFYLFKFIFPSPLKIMAFMIMSVNSGAQRTTWQTQEGPSCKSVTIFCNLEGVLLFSVGLFPHSITTSETNILIPNNIMCCIYSA